MAARVMRASMLDATGPAEGQPQGAVAISDGVYGQPMVRTGLPPHLSREQHMGRVGACSCVPLLDQLRVVRQSPVKVRGFRRACVDDSHDEQHWLSGRLGTLDLVLSVCAFCWLVRVRDKSFVILIDEGGDGTRLRLTPPGMERRKDEVLGIYSGSRPLGRTYL